MAKANKKDVAAGVAAASAAAAAKAPAKAAAPAPAAAPKPAAKKALSPEERIAALESDLREVKGDLSRLAVLLGKQWGDPLKSELASIVLYHQGPEARA